MVISPSLEWEKFLSIDPAIISTPDPMPEMYLLAAVVHLACADLCHPQHGPAALDFLCSDDLDLFCEWLSWDANKIRELAADGVTGRNPVRG